MDHGTANGAAAAIGGSLILLWFLALVLLVLRPQGPIVPLKPERQAAGQASTNRNRRAGNDSAAPPSLRCGRQTSQGAKVMSGRTPSSAMALGIAFAGGAVLTTLLDELLNQGILTNDDIRGVLQRAQNGVAPFYGEVIGREAGLAITNLFARFPEKYPKPSSE